MGYHHRVIDVVIWPCKLAWHVQVNVPGQAHNTAAWCASSKFDGLIRRPACRWWWWWFLWWPWWSCHLPWCLFFSMWYMSSLEIYITCYIHSKLIDVLHEYIYIYIFFFICYLKIRRSIVNFNVDTKMA